MGRSLGRFSDPGSSVHTLSWAGFITATLGFKFSVHTGPVMEPASSPRFLSRWSILLTFADLNGGGLTPPFGGCRDLDQYRPTMMICAHNKRPDHRKRASQPF